MKASVGALVTGDPEHDDTFCGAVNSKQHYEKVRIEFITGLVFKFRICPKFDIFFLRGFKSITAPGLDLQKIFYKQVT